MPEQTNGQSSVILTSNGLPFKTERAASFTMNSKKLTTDTHEIVEHEGGFAIRKRNGTAPPTTKQTDTPTPKPKPKPKAYLLCPKCLHKNTKAEEGDPCTNEKVRNGCDGYYAPDPAVEETYHRVKFQTKAQPNDTEDVILSVNGKVLTIMRNAEVIIPDRFKVCADNALKQQFTHKPGEPRKRLSPVQTYPYSYIEIASAEEFFAMKAEGRRQAAG